ncbi:MAG: hypothetical protein KIT59_03520 [Nitrosomonas sp.]|nr:hypothetical protein [Nitrosomonas sp.]
MNTNKDYINVHPSTVSHDGSGSNGIGYVVRELARDIHIDGFNPQQGDVLIFDNSLGISSQDELANLITNIHVEADNFIVNFGNNTTITLTGVQPDQIGWDDVIVGDPDTPDSNTDDLVTADPGTTDPDVDDPVTADPGTTDPDVSDPVTADSGQNIDINPGETIQGEEGSENFVFHDLGHWTINNFNAMEDMLDFTGYNLSREEIASHITNIAVESDNFIVNFGDDVSITLIGQSPTWDNVTTVEG